VDVFLVGVTAENELELGSGDEFADNVLNIVPDDALGRREVTDAHADDPTLHV
jgi:hypothetical protein